jgi:hypothetical protein
MMPATGSIQIQPNKRPSSASTLKLAHQPVVFTATNRVSMDYARASGCMTDPSNGCYRYRLPEDERHNFSQGA